MKFLFQTNAENFSFNLEKQKSFIPEKKYDLGRSLEIGQESSNRWRFAVPIFREGFGQKNLICNFGYQLMHIGDICVKYSLGQKTVCCFAQEVNDLYFVIPFRDNLFFL